MLFRPEAERGRFSNVSPLKKNQLIIQNKEKLICVGTMAQVHLFVVSLFYIFLCINAPLIDFIHGRFHVIVAPK